MWGDTCALQGDYYEAVAKAIDVQRKELVACFPKDAGLDEACFKISYDILIVGVSTLDLEMDMVSAPFMIVWPQALEQPLVFCTSHHTVSMLHCIAELCK